MKTLKQFQEEGKKGFRRIWSNITKDTQHLTTEKIEDFLYQQTSLAYELGKKEAIEMVIGELESNPNEDDSESPNIHHWIERKQIQLRKITSS